MFFWNYTRNGKINSDYISLVVDFSVGCVSNGAVRLSFEDCEDLLILLQDVELTGGRTLQKNAYKTELLKVGFTPPEAWISPVDYFHLKNGVGNFGRHPGSPTGYGRSRSASWGGNIQLNFLEHPTCLIKCDGKKFSYDGSIPIDSKDNLCYYRKSRAFVDTDYINIMPKHSWIPEIFNKMCEVDSDKAREFVSTVLGWRVSDKETSELIEYFKEYNLW